MRTWLACSKTIIAALMLAAATLASTTGSRAQEAAVAISVKNHHFQPAEVQAPANRRLAITVRNLDAAAMEFESASLRVEKVIAAGSEGVVNVRPLAPGRYEFFDDFHQETRGVLVVQ
ncbi:MAG TPA: cupredoxin domain-containing protein [Xanthobacteraceae bacterium]|nr:cupredoxin domain-containing protein [Xanthobacteraceae bacterium]